MSPLDQLRDIHLPDSVNWWPLAIGWWLLMGLLLTLLVLTWVHYQKTTKQRLMISHAMQSLERLEADTSLGSEQWLQALSTLLRRIVINLHGRKATAGLVGKPWLDYLDNHSKKKGFSNGIGEVLATQPYQAVADYDREALSELVRQWVKSQTRKGDDNA